MTTPAIAKFGKFDYSLRSPAVKRIFHEATEMSDPTYEYYAHPLDDNLFEWHFTVRGPPETPFAKGFYHGRILLPHDYPMKPPSIIMLTPNGRFEVQTKICLSVSSHHPESWQPCWSIRTVLMAIIAFMPSKAEGSIGSLDYTAQERAKLAKLSHSWTCSECGKINKLLLDTPNYETNGAGLSSSSSSSAAASTSKAADEEFIKNVQFKKATEDEGSSDQKFDDQKPSTSRAALAASEAVETLSTASSSSNNSGSTKSLTTPEEAVEGSVGDEEYDEEDEADEEDAADGAEDVAGGSHSPQSSEGHGSGEAMSERSDFERQAEALMRLLRSDNDDDIYEDEDDEEEGEEEEEPSFDLFGSDESCDDDISLGDGHFLSAANFHEYDLGIYQRHNERIAVEQRAAREEAERLARARAMEPPAGVRDIIGPNAPTFWDYVVVILVLSIITLLLRRILITIFGPD